MPTNDSNQAGPKRKLFARVPANWKDLSPAEKRKWSLGFIRLVRGVAPQPPPPPPAGDRGVVALLSADMSDEEIDSFLEVINEGMPEAPPEKTFLEVSADWEAMSEAEQDGA